MPRVNFKAPQIQTRDVDGTQIVFPPAETKVAVLTFYKSACPQCQRGLPKLAEVYERFRNHDGVDFIGIAVGLDDAAMARQFSRQRQFYFPVVADEDSAIREAYKLQQVPTVILTDMSGAVRARYPGLTPELPEVVGQTIQALVDGAPLPDYKMIGAG